MPARILVIEDNADNMTLVTYLLEAGGHVPLMATNGSEGVRLAAHERPDLILLDIQLPDMHGYDVAAAIRENAPRGRVPIVAVTALAMVGDHERIMAAGFDGYLTKPLSPESFVRDVEQFLAGDPGAHDPEPAGP